MLDILLTNIWSGSCIYENMVDVFWFRRTVDLGSVLWWVLFSFFVILHFMCANNIICNCFVRPITRKFLIVYLFYVVLLVFCCGIGCRSRFWIVLADYLLVHYLLIKRYNYIWVKYYLHNMKFALLVFVVCCWFVCVMNGCKLNATYLALQRFVIVYYKRCRNYTYHKCLAISISSFSSVIIQRGVLAFFIVF